jgi:putative hemolysin
MAIVIRVLLPAVVVGLILVNAGCAIAPPSSPAATIAKPTEITSSPSDPQPEPARPPNATPVVGLANPAANYCSEQGGRLEIQTTSDGGQIGVCLFNDGSLCEEWAFFRGECRPGDQYALPEGAAETTTIEPKFAELFALVRENLPANAFDSFAAQPLTSGDKRQLWAVYSTGVRNFDLDPSVPHFIAIYEYTVSGW